MTQLIQLDMISERHLLLRFCARYTGDPDAAEDLAQQTLLKAWQHEQQLKDPQARRGWLLSIARNQCLMWARNRSHELSRFVQLDQWDEQESPDHLTSDFDLESAMDRDDLARLLDRALALLPPDSREILVRRYLEEIPQSEVAARLGLTEGAVEARLHRGKLALRRLLSTELSAEAVSYGLISPAEAGWEQTRIWCPGCGQCRLEGWFRPTEGKLFMRCPGCSHSDAHFIHAELRDALRNTSSYKPAIIRVLKTIHDMFRVRATGGRSKCPKCGQWLPIDQGVPPCLPARFTNPNSIYLWHPECGGYDTETWHSLTWSLPETRAFWDQNPRMRFLPEHEVEFAGSPAIVTGFESVTSSARLEVVALRDSLEVVSINGGGHA